MRYPRSVIRRTLFAVLALLFACGDDDGGMTPDASVPLPISLESLRGYWVSTAESDRARPQLLHIDPAITDDVPAPGPIAEYSDGAISRIGPIVLQDDGSFELRTFTDGREGSYATGLIESVTASELRIQYTAGGGHLVYRRTEGCGASGFWNSAGTGLADAAWAPDGTLHVLQGASASGYDQTGTYAYVPPGRCTLYRPSQAIRGDSVDVGASGTIRIMAVAETIVEIVTIPPEPWTRPALDAVRTELFTDRGTLRPRPATRVLEIDGRAVAMWANDVQYIWFERDGGAFELLGPGTPGTGAAGPQSLVAERDPSTDTYYVHGSDFGGNLGSVFRLVGEMLEPFELPIHPVLGRVRTFAFSPSGELFAAWSAPGRPRLPGAALAVVGRLNGDDAWEIVEAGPGIPFDMHVSEGFVDLVSFDTQEQLPAYWTRLDRRDDGGLRESHWRSAILLDGLIGNRSIIRNLDIASDFPIARFGPTGQIAVGGLHLFWRDPAIENGPAFDALTATLRFDTDAPVTVTLPAVNANGPTLATDDFTCTETCTFGMMPGTVLPALAQGGEGAVRVSVRSMYPNDPQIPGDEVHLFAPNVRFDESLEREFVVEGGAVHLEAVDVHPGESPRLLRALAVDGPNLLLAHDTHLDVFDASLAAVGSTDFDGIADIRVGDDGMIRVLAPLGGVGQLLTLNAALEVTEMSAFAGGSWAALTGMGAWEVALGDGGYLAIVRHEAGRRDVIVQTDLVQAVNAIGDDERLFVSVPDTSGRQRFLSFDRSGAAPWEIGYTAQAIIGPTVPWAVREGNLVVFASSDTHLTIEGVATPSNEGDPLAAVVEIDGATGRVARMRSMGTATAYAAVSSIAPTDAGVATVTASGVSLAFQYFPWNETDAIRESSYTAGVNCSLPGARCEGDRPHIVARGDGTFSAAWSYTLPYELDGITLGTEGLPGLAIGTWTP